eukprot:11161174-Lingulodinium_polyedra.AAC.1
MQGQGVAMGMGVAPVLAGSPGLGVWGCTWGACLGRFTTGGHMSEVRRLTCKCPGNLRMLPLISRVRGT